MMEERKKRRRVGLRVPAAEHTDNTVLNLKLRLKKNLPLDDTHVIPPVGGCFER